MRPLNDKIETSISQTVQTPAYLVELVFSNVIRLSTRGLVDYGGFTWLQGGVKVMDISTGQAGTKTCRIVVPNNQFAFSSIVLAETASGKSVRVWKLFGDPPYDISDAQLILDGFIDDVPELVERVVFNCSSQNARTLMIPSITIGSPFFNHLPRAGQVIFWGNEQYELQPR